MLQLEQINYSTDEVKDGFEKVERNLMKLNAGLDNAGGGGTPPDLTNYYTKGEVDAKIDEIDGQAAGKSAYEIWLEQGNVGTEQDFLNSFKPNMNEYYKRTETYSREEVNGLIGSGGSGGSVDLTNYYTKADIDAKLQGHRKISVSFSPPTSAQGSDGEVWLVLKA